MENINELLNIEELEEKSAPLIVSVTGSTIVWEEPFSIKPIGHLR
jgi:hypothetical protein